MTRKSWRDILPVHPVADLFPLLPEDKLRELGENIKKNGLRQPVVVWYEVLGSRLSEDNEQQPYLLDGRNRLDAMELVGIPTVSPENYLRQHVGREVLKKSVSATLVSAPLGSSGLGDFKESPGEVPDPAAYVISANIRRRHLTKAQQVSLIVRVVEAGEKFANREKGESIDSAKVARSIGGSPKGKKGGGGSTKDPVKKKVVEEAAKLGISERTAERAIAEAKPESKPKVSTIYVTCSECSQSIAESALSKHLETKHKVKLARKASEHPRSQGTVRQLEKALMNTQEATAEINVYEVMADKAALKKILRLYDQLEESITLGRERIKNRPSDKEIKRSLSGGTSIKKLGPG